ncbi:helix-turn-helix domain-containing protein [Streptomyces aurantiacus]|uniref:helix-turn-helix domain-containing protein n=1 Tax=Streptomyces aurantiacus TaxID=47760 RepID=UPI0005635791|nr:helix-turn-helix domain-containing protein [Streptomyces aurantiacus]
MSSVTSSVAPLLYRPEEAATVLGIGRSMVYEEIRLGRLQTVRIGRRRLVPPEYVAAYVELLKREAETAA